ncbi:alpha/beta hydrolase [Pseudonocardia phyllosphaerae]|uniref:alpha/beta hydrolase n=1 Tax=Pseudonocardia phyllosphaerae TaxID=3390502 RepID=UPI00397B488C
MERIDFPNGPITMAGALYLPDGVDTTDATGLPAVVVVHPGGGVKEQTAGTYADRLAAQGFVALAFDASHQGESGGEPHHLEDPSARVEDVRAAVDHLQSLDLVDPERIGVIGICAGGAYAVNAAMTDHRIKAVTTVSALNIGDGYRQGWFGADPVSAAVPTLDAAAQQRTAEARGAEQAFVPYVPEPDQVDDSTPRDMAEASDYYRTPRAQHPNADNRKLFTRSIARIMAFDAFHLVEDLFTAPLLAVAGSEAGSLWHTTKLHGKVRSPKKLVIVEGGTHMDFYDVDAYVDRAVAEAVPFFTEHLAETASPVPA